MIETPEGSSAVTSGDLGLRPGMTVEVLAVDGRRAFMGKVESCRGGAVVIRDSRGDDLPPVTYNAEVHLRFFHGEGNTELKGKVCGSTGQFWKLDRLEGSFTKEQRAFFRQRIRTDTRARCCRLSGVGVQGTTPIPCQVLDVSAGGILISCTGIYEVGDRLSVDNVRLTQRGEPFSFSCLVRRVGERSVGGIRYGCQFRTLSAKEQDRLLQAIFIVQREEIRGQKAF